MVMNSVICSTSFTPFTHATSSSAVNCKSELKMDNKLVQEIKINGDSINLLLD